MSHYDDILLELRQKGQMLANKYIAELYNILREEEKLTPEDSRSKIEHDCIDLWSKATIRKYLPSETKDIKKQNAGRVGGETKNRKDKPLLIVTAAENGARINLAENDSFSQKEQESSTFQNELNQQLSNRTISPELLEANKIIAEKDKTIEEKDSEIEELIKQVYGINNRLTMSNNFAKEIYNSVRINR